MVELRRPIDGTVAVSCVGYVSGKVLNGPTMEGTPPVQLNDVTVFRIAGIVKPRPRKCVVEKSEVPQRFSTITDFLPQLTGCLARLTNRLCLPIVSI